MIRQKVFATDPGTACCPPELKAFQNAGELGGHVAIAAIGIRAALRIARDMSGVR